MVQLTIVDYSGRRHVVRGLEGQSVVDVIEGHMDSLGEEGTHQLPARSAHPRTVNRGACCD